VETLANHLIESNSEYAAELIKMDPEIIVKSMALHDVGKIAIPDRILQKPGRLDPDEYEEMKTHTTRGKEIIGELGDVETSLYLKHCEDICYSHHERWDGRGYPRGLKEFDIPLSARIASVADVYDALVCQRVYKEAMAHENARQIIMDGKGSQFDPVVCDAFEKVQSRFIEIARQYA
jgi:putative two-component system response regulator